MDGHPYGGPMLTRTTTFQPNGTRIRSPRHRGRTSQPFRASVSTTRGPTFRAVIHFPLFKVPTRGSHRLVTSRAFLTTSKRRLYRRGTSVCKGKFHPGSHQ